MKKVIIYFLVLLFSVWLGVIACRNPGYILISCHNLSIEMSLWLAVIFIAILFLLFYAMLRFSSKINSIAVRVKIWISNRRKRKARTKTILGLYDFAEGNWLSSEKKLVRAAKYSDMPLINYLAAAFMAQRQYAFKRRDNYLFLAQKVDASHPIVIGLTQARLHIFNQQWEVALATLRHLHQLRPKNAFILQLLQQTYLELKDWQCLKALLPILRKRRAFGINEINQLELKVYTELLLAGKLNHSISDAWDDLPRYLKKQPALAAIYIEYLLNNNKIDEAEDILKIILNKILDERLLELYAALPKINPIKKIALAENWLKKNSENAALLLCLGRVCKQQKLWGKARQYLEKSLSLTATPAVYLELGQIMEMQNDLRGAIECYKKMQLPQLSFS